MTLGLQAGPRLDGEVHRALYGPARLEGEVLPAYSTDETVALEALQRHLGPLELTHWRHPRGPALNVGEDGKLLFRALVERTRALAVCSAITHVAAYRAPRREVSPMETGFYWFRPVPGVCFFPTLWRDDDGSIWGMPFSFTKAEPVPVFVHRLDDGLEVTGIGSPLEWPGDEGGPLTVLADVLPGDYGPRIAPPASWHPGHRPEESVEFPCQSTAMYEDES